MNVYVFSMWLYISILVCTLCIYVCIFPACTYVHICIYLYQFTNIHVYMISFLRVPMTILFFFHLILSGEPSMQHHTYVNISRDICISIHTYIMSFFLSFLQNTAFAYTLICCEYVRLGVMYVYLSYSCFFIYFFVSFVPFSSIFVLNLRYLTKISVWFFGTQVHPSQPHPKKCDVTQGCRTPSGVGLKCAGP